jgi:hypothetical protein
MWSSGTLTGQVIFSYHAGRLCANGSSFEATVLEDLSNVYEPAIAPSSAHPVSGAVEIVDIADVSNSTDDYTGPTAFEGALTCSVQRRRIGRHVLSRDSPIYQHTSDISICILHVSRLSTDHKSSSAGRSKTCI